MDKFVPVKLLQKIQDYRLTTFCAPAHDVPLHAAGGRGVVRSVERAELRHGGRAFERRGHHPVGTPHRQEDPRGLRPDGGAGAVGDVPVDRAAPRLDGQALAASEREAAGRGRRRSARRRGGRHLRDRLARGVPAGPVHGLLPRRGAHAAGRGRRLLQPARHGVARLGRLLLLRGAATTT